MTDIILDGRKVQVGDRMVCVACGEVRITNLRPACTYAIEGEVVNTHLMRRWTGSGQYLDVGERTLYWPGTKVIPAEPPKRIVKVVRYENVYKNEDGQYISGGTFFKTRERAKEIGEYGGVPKYITTVEIIFEAVED